MLWAWGHTTAMRGDAAPQAGLSIQAQPWVGFSRGWRWVGAQDRDRLENCHTGAGVEHTFPMTTAARGGETAQGRVRNSHSDEQSRSGPSC